MARLLRFAASCHLLLASVATAQSTLPVAHSGVADLREVDLSVRSVPLTGEWTLYWHQLLTPVSAVAKPTANVQFPALWSHTIVDGRPLPSTGFASYTLTVLLPHIHGPLALDVPSTYTSYRLYVNGTVFSESGNPDSSAATSTPKWLEIVRELPAEGDTLRLILQVANYWHSKGGPFKEMRIGDARALMRERFDDSAYALLLAGCLIMGGFFFLGIYRFGERDKAILYFALFCIAYSYRVVGTQLYVLHTMFPNVPWSLTTHLEYLSLFLSVAFFSLYTANLFPEDAGRLIVRGNALMCLVMSVIVLATPPRIFTQLINPFLIVMFSIIGYAFWVYIKAVRNRRVGAGYALISTGVLLAVFLFINLEYFGRISVPRLVLFLGYLSFFCLQSIILLFRFAYTLTSAKRDAELGAAAKSEFLSTMSHEIRTPLNAITGMTHLLLRDEPRPDQAERLGILQHSASNLLVIVNDILDFSKIEAGMVSFEFMEMDIAETARLIVEGQRLSAEAKGIALKLEVDPALTRDISADPARLSQVLTNLLSNAIKFTAHGHVLLSIRVEHQDASSVTLRIGVEDTGIGIALEKQNMIFDKFAQADTSTSRQFGGTGLGLAICKRLLELQGSRLQLRSEVGKGSEFFFVQTYVAAELLASTPRKGRAAFVVPDGKPLEGVRLLMAEDNAINVMVAKAMLERWGAVVDVASNGQEALDMLDPSVHKLVLMDMHMAVMDGYESTRLMRDRGIRLPIVALTASVPSNFETHLVETGLDGVVLKPIVPEELLKSVLSHLG